LLILQIIGSGERRCHLSENVLSVGDWHVLKSEFDSFKCFTENLAKLSSYDSSLIRSTTWSLLLFCLYTRLYSR